MRVWVSVLVGVTGAPLWVAAQTPSHVVVVDSGMVYGDARMILAHAASHVELALLGQSRQYRRGQAQLRLRQFLRNNPPESFTWATQESTGTDWFATGRYRVRPTGSPLRVYVHWERRGRSWRLVTIHVFR